MDRAESFHALTPDRVLDVVERAGFAPTGHCFALNALENRVYDVRLEDERHVVVKFYRPGRWSREAILDEHRLLGALVEAEIPVCAPLRFGQGETVATAFDIHYAIWPRTGGRSPEELRDEEVALLGRLLARIHNVAEATGAPHRQRLDAQTFPLASLALLEDRGFLPPSCAARYRRAVEAVVAIYDDWSDGVALHPIHGDCHAGNLLRDGERWFFLDFDDLVVGPAVHDVWMLLPGRDAHAARQRALLVEAYREFRDFDERSLRLVEPLRAFRFVFYAGWIAKRWDDPCFRDAFPHFGTESYWQAETADLEEQLARIQGERVASGGDPGSERPAGEEEPELTNEDFFWDL